MGMCYEKQMKKQICIGMDLIKKKRKLQHGRNGGKCQKNKT